MDTDDITFDDLLAPEPADTPPPRSFAQLLAEGFPRNGGLVELAAIVQLEDPGSQFAALRYGYSQILQRQEFAHGAQGQSPVAAPIPRATARATGPKRT